MIRLLGGTPHRSMPLGFASLLGGRAERNTIHIWPMRHLLAVYALRICYLCLHNSLEYRVGYFAG